MTHKTMTNEPTLTPDAVQHYCDAASAMLADAWVPCEDFMRPAPGRYLALYLGCVAIGHCPATLPARKEVTHEAEL